MKAGSVCQQNVSRPLCVVVTNIDQGVSSCCSFTLLVDNDLVVLLYSLKYVRTNNYNTVLLGAGICI